MKALILAAGLGSRLKSETEEQPKALVPVLGEPILRYQLRSLKANGISQVGIVVGYQGKKIVRYLENHHSGLELTFFSNNDFARSNSSYSFWVAKDWVSSDSYLHLNCDIIFSDNLLRRMLSSPHENVIAVRTDVPLGNQMENVVLDGDRIVQMSLVNMPEATAKAFGLAKLSAASSRFIIERLRGFIEAGNCNENYYGMIREAVRHLDYRALDAGEDLLLEINTLDDLALAEKSLKGD